MKSFLKSFLKLAWYEAQNSVQSPNWLGRWQVPVLTATGLSALLVLSSLAIAAGEASEKSSDPSDGAPAPTEWQAQSSSAANRPGGVRTMLREGPTGGIWQRSQLLGDPGGIRSFLGHYGATITIQEASEYLGNTTGGIRQGFTYDGLTTIDLQVDTKRAFGLYGGTFNASALDIHGTNLSPRNLGTLQTASGTEADDGFRLWELWYQQMFFFNQLDIKVGAQSLDQEFMVTQYGGLFINTMFGWPMLTSADMLSGGPAYPLASLGARVRGQPAGTPWIFMVGAYDDNPAGVDPQVLPAQDPQLLNSRGTNFRLQDPVLLIAEVQFSRPAIGQIEYADAEPIRPGTFKLGAWYDTGRFADQEYGTDGLPLSDGNSNHTPRLHRGNYSVYGVVDQLLWRKSPESAEGVGFFVRLMGAPAEQNQIGFSANAGLNWHAPLRHREYDVAGLGFGETNVSSRARALDRDAAAGATSYSPIRDSETFVELTYQYQVVPWWQLQPDIQYTWNAGANVVNPNNPSQSIKNELVMGLRTNIAL